jgi:hypothetical protein
MIVLDTCVKTYTFLFKDSIGLNLWKGADHGKQGTEGQEQGKEEEKEGEAQEVIGSPVPFNIMSPRSVFGLGDALLNSKVSYQ